MSALRDPNYSAAFDAATDRVVIAFRDGRDAMVIEFDADAIPALINALMRARCEAKQAKKAVPLPEPVRPMCGKSPYVKPRRLGGRGGFRL